MAFAAGRRPHCGIERGMDREDLSAGTARARMMAKRKWSMEALAASLLLLTGTASGDWQRVGEDNLGVVYADTEVVRNGNIAKMWSLLDYKDYQRMVEVGYFSQKTQVEYDCSERKA